MKRQDLPIAQGSGSSATGADALSAFCPHFHHAIELLGGRWTGAIVRALMGGKFHFNEIAAAIPGLSARMLSDRLKMLEGEGIVVRTVFPETPVRIEYRLSEKGRDLGRVIASVSDWAERWPREMDADGAAEGDRKRDRALRSSS